MRTLYFGKAINVALAEEMEKDSSVYIIGQDVGYGGGYGITKGLRKKFGEERVLDAPLSENLILGHAAGSALLGRRPVVEIQFSDFLSVGFPMITQLIASYRWRSGTGLPIVIRAPYGGGKNGGPFHSQCPESWFLNVPGLKIVIPSTPADAYGLLKTAIADPDPVLYLEHKKLYWEKKGELPDGLAAFLGETAISFGKAAIRRYGHDCLIVSYGLTALMAEEAAKVLWEKNEISCAVLDLRTLMPLDEQEMIRFANSCGKVLIVHEAPKVWGPGAWLAQIVREANHHVRVGILGSQYTLSPFSPPLEEFYLPNSEKIVQAVKDLLTWRKK